MNADRFIENYTNLLQRLINVIGNPEYSGIIREKNDEVKNLTEEAFNWVNGRLDELNRPSNWVSRNAPPSSPSNRNNRLSRNEVERFQKKYRSYTNYESDPNRGVLTVGQTEQIFPSYEPPGPPTKKGKTRRSKRRSS